eukprot:CAMPEP_0170540430 /NCGR_PEP_ID=MMETSP0211-20121228/437_1 /TAXON_ID=311385 /ORGANISM="Pseudokeronopsis sp., Strain OXSARD2" /LENGTH=123 /DNA_ID=CAMNT_0010842843 /DNA_START=275 /DNA_END=646 /DNA_ORIENTATION=-
MALDQCEPQLAECPSFRSSASMAGNWENSTVTLATTEYCEISLDGSSAVARAFFEDGANFGIVEHEKYVQGEAIIANAEQIVLTVYNADSSGGTVSFTLAFTAAIHLIASSGVALLSLFGAIL